MCLTQPRTGCQRAVDEKPEEKKAKLWFLLCLENDVIKLLAWTAENVGNIPKKKYVRQLINTNIMSLSSFYGVCGICQFSKIFLL